MALRFAAVPVGFGLLVSSAYAAAALPSADEKPPAPKVQTPKPPPNRPGSARPPAQKAQPDNHPGEQQVDRLLKMTPDQQENELKKYPPAQRQKIRQQLRDVKNWPSVEQTRARARLERLNSLPPQRQNQVRRSAKQLQELPPDRQNKLRMELSRMAALPDDDRRAYMNTEEFRNRYSANEQQIMSNLALVEPQI